MKNEINHCKAYWTNQMHRVSLFKKNLRHTHILHLQKIKISLFTASFYPEKFHSAVPLPENQEPFVVRKMNTNVCVFLLFAWWLLVLCLINYFFLSSSFSYRIVHRTFSNFYYRQYLHTRTSASWILFFLFHYFFFSFSFEGFAVSLRKLSGYTLRRMFTVHLKSFSIFLRSFFSFSHNVLLLLQNLT